MCSFFSAIQKIPTLIRFLFSKFGELWHFDFPLTNDPGSIYSMAFLFVHTKSLRSK